MFFYRAIGLATLGWAAFAYGQSESAGTAAKSSAGTAATSASSATNSQTKSAPATPAASAPANVTATAKPAATPPQPFNSGSQSRAAPATPPTQGASTEAIVAAALAAELAKQAGAAKGADSVAGGKQLKAAAPPSGPKGLGPNFRQPGVRALDSGSASLEALARPNLRTELMTLEAAQDYILRAEDNLVKNKERLDALRAEGREDEYQKWKDKVEIQEALLEDQKKRVMKRESFSEKRVLHKVDKEHKHYLSHSKYYEGIYQDDLDMRFD